MATAMPAAALQASHSPLDTDGVGVLCATTRWAMRGVDGDREATFSMS